MGLVEGEEYSFYIHDDKDGRFICIKCPDNVDKLKEAKNLLLRLGYSISSEETVGLAADD